jgi:hypothetical protein
MAYATGPVSDVAIAVMGASQGKPLPAGAADARTAHARATPVNIKAREHIARVCKLHFKFIFPFLSDCC